MIKNELFCFWFFWLFFKCIKFQLKYFVTFIGIKLTILLSALGQTINHKLISVWIHTNLRWCGHGKTLMTSFFSRLRESAYSFCCTKSSNSRSVWTAFTPKGHWWQEEEEISRFEKHLYFWRSGSCYSHLNNMWHFRG